MNPAIALLAKSPRGTKWRSRLVPHTDDIRKWRESGETYGRIVYYLSLRGLNISAGAVQNFVKVRSCNTRQEYVLPHKPILNASEESTSATAMQTAPQWTQDTAVQSTPAQKKIKHVFSPQPLKQRKFNPDELTVNNPLQ